MNAPDGDEPTLGEQFNDALYLDPGFSLDEPGLVGEALDEIDDTVEESRNRSSTDEP